MTACLLALTILLAFSNGANDVSKGIATLVGSGVSNYRRAVLWGTLCTVAGALSAGFASQKLVATFSGKGILTAPQSGSSFLPAVAIGAIAWLLIATRTGLPVSTTHSLAGALVGAATVATGSNVIVWRALGERIALPLIASPAIAVAVLFVILPLIRPLLTRANRYCVCLEQRDLVAVTPEGVSFRESFSSVEVAPAASCTTAAARFNSIDLLHWISAGATSFFRGLNDTPKIIALGIAAAATLGVATAPAYAVVALAMGAGSAIAGFRVTRTLAERVTPITPASGLPLAGFTMSA